ncbi:MAG: TIGR04086 family membrane protein [Ruminiclostridium sp.]|nr:TIGR04086 family membrane protein [Ruminiclostridium sp.]
MSEKKTGVIILQKAGTYVFSTVMGALLSVALITLFALLMYALQMPLYFAEYLSLTALGCGCMLSGFICGRIKKRGGLKLGLQCAAILLALCALGALISGGLNGSAAVSKIITGVLTGCTGGVLGVNRN